MSLAQERLLRRVALHTYEPYVADYHERVWATALAARALVTLDETTGVITLTPLGHQWANELKRQ